MNTNTVLVAVVALLIGSIGGYTLSALTSNHKLSGIMTHDSAFNDDGMRMDDMDDMRQMMDVTIGSEREFLTSMIPHHQEAVDTAKAVIARGGTTPEIKQLVANIVVAQETEIAAMKEWYQAWYGETYTGTSEYRPMVRNLGQLSGAELDRTFLEDMVMHHMGAIMMAKSVQPYIRHSEIKTLADAIVQTQAAEIQLMRQLLGTL